MPIYPEANPQSAQYVRTHTPEERDLLAAQLPLTDLAFLNQGEHWPPHAAAPRLAEYRNNTLLWNGLHEQVFTENFWLALDKDTAESLELVFNWHRRLSTLWADLLLSEAPRFLDGTEDEQRDKPEDTDGTRNPQSPASKPENADKRGDTSDPLNPPPPPPLNTEPSPAAKARQEQIDKLTQKDDNGYVSTLYEVAIDVSRFGDGLVKIVLEEEGAQIYPVTPSYWFPVVAPDNIRKVTHHVLAHRFRRSDLDYLWAEVHEKGKIACKVYLLEGNVIGPEQDLAAFSTRPPVQLTGVDDFLVVPFKGLRTSDQIFGESDYDDIDSIVQAIEARAAQINKILSKHSDPPMYGPPGVLTRDETTGETVFRPGGRFFEVDGEDEEPPGYVVWEPQMEAQFKELEFLLHQLYIVSQTSPAAFGQLEQGLVESGSALRRLMQAPLAKVARINNDFDPAARRAIKIAAHLEAAHRGAPTIEKVQIQWQDGLPPDPREQAETEKFRSDAGNTSLVSSIQRLDGGTEEEAKAELERIQEEQQRTAHNELQTMKAEGALELQKVEAQAAAKPPSQANGAPSSSGKKK